MNRNVFGAIWLVVFLLIAEYAWGHGQHFTDQENDWLNAQYSPDATKCCDRHDTVVGPDVEWRIEGGQYQVLISDVWRNVRPGAVVPRTPDNPWPGQAIVTYSLFPGGGLHIWCFWPGMVM